MKLPKTRRIRSLSPLLFTAMAGMFLTSSPVFAGQFDWVKGKGTEVCDVYFRYLATERDGDRLTCDREFPSELAELQRPAWESLDPLKNKPLIGRIENYLQAPRDQKASKPWRPVYKDETPDQFYISDLARLAVTQVDIDNDGKPETLAKFRSFSCDTWRTTASPRGPRWVAPIVVLTDNRQDVDRDKTYPLMQNPGKKFVANAAEIDAAEEKLLSDINSRHLPPSVVPEMRKSIPRARFAYTKYAPGVASLMGYDTFLYKQQAYFDKWDEQQGQKGIHTLSVYRTQGGKTDELCRYRWRD